MTLKQASGSNLMTLSDPALCNGLCLTGDQDTGAPLAPQQSCSKRQEDYIACSVGNVKGNCFYVPYISDRYLSLALIDKDKVLKI